MSFPTIAHIAEDEIFNQYSTERRPVGQKAITEDGRQFRFCENGGVAMVVASMYQSVISATIADGLNEVVGTMAAGDTVLTGVGATTNSQAIDSLKEGYVFSLTAADLNPCYRIKSNTLITQGAATGTITLYTPLQAAIAPAPPISFF